MGDSPAMSSISNENEFDDQDIIQEVNEPKPVPELSNENEVAKKEQKCVETLVDIDLSDSFKVV